MNSKKFTLMESRVIIECLNLGMEQDVKDIERSESEGKSPFITSNYVKQLYSSIIEKVNTISSTK